MRRVSVQGSSGWSSSETPGGGMTKREMALPRRDRIDGGSKGRHVGHVGWSENNFRFLYAWYGNICGGNGG